MPPHTGSAAKIKTCQSCADLAPSPALLHLLPSPTSSFQGPGKTTNPISGGPGVTLPCHSLCCPLALSSVHGADGCCHSTVLFRGGTKCDVNLINELHPLLSSAGKAVPSQGASLAGASSSQGHQSASSRHPFALPRGISHSSALPCLGYEPDTSTVFVPPPRGISSSHSQTPFPSQ